MVRGHALVLTLALALPALAGCSSDPEITSDRSDLERAVAVWSDPWVAPDSATVAGPALGSNGQVTRVVARRLTTYDTDAAAAARSELRLAEEAGWSPTSSTCGDAVQMALAGPDGAVAILSVNPDGTGAQAGVRALTRHHLDTRWSVPDEIARTCLDGESPLFEAPPLQSAPLGDEDADEDVAAWSDDPGSDVVDAANADPALDALGVRLASPRLEPGVNRRRAPVTELDVASGTVADLSARLPGWQLTYAACGGGGATRATFVRTIDGLPAVVDATFARNGAQLRITLTMAEGPDGDWVTELQPLDPSVTCAPTDLEVGPRQSSGMPAVLPSDLTPIAD
ncbi:hypothetical protein SAMN04489844_1693 [Nocardioides exalbidus]|uniref:Uncharacterized protein n=1 Tax=Nocardioides exalbidus TaxID=402596 RepID=A0A1H4PUD4_9ACTN|nr:hypothetical protein [Nocardioides exalbidus]SEC10782.1 hypothetical protein SAMN04489844_1693 [Nocardioides exalbidus]